MQKAEHRTFRLSAILKQSGQRILRNGKKTKEVGSARRLSNDSWSDGCKMENPEFREVVFELDAQYAALDKALTKGKPNCLEQANDTRKRTPFHSVLQRPERRAMEDKH